MKNIFRFNVKKIKIDEVLINQLTKQKISSFQKVFFFSYSNASGFSVFTSDLMFLTCKLMSDVFDQKLRKYWQISFRNKGISKKNRKGGLLKSSEKKVQKRSDFQ